MWRTKAERLWNDALVRNVLSLAAALAIVGASLGAIAVSKGVSLWLITLMAALVFAGGSEFMTVGLISAGAAPITAVISGLMLNARHLPFGFAVGDLVGRRWPTRLVGTHVMVDESVAFALAEQTPERSRRAYWTAGLALYFTWAPSVFVGGFLGQWVGNPEALGLDAALPAALLALIVPSLRDRRNLRAVVLGASVAVATTPLLPDGLPVMVGLIGVAAALPLPEKVERRMELR
jgi:4-azaleucine resistance transporter AzlC